MSLNKVMLIGNVGMDPEVRYLDNQTKNARIRIATTETYTDRNGERRENTEWHTVICWRRLADTVEKYVKKGSQLYIEGRLQTREWTDQTGAKRYSTEVNADNIQLLGRRDNSAGAPQGAAPQGNNQGYNQGYNQGGYAQPQNNYRQNAQPSFQQGGYQQAPAPAAAPTPMPQAPVQDFGGEGDDDLPF